MCIYVDTVYRIGYTSSTVWVKYALEIKITQTNINKMVVNIPSKHLRPYTTLRISRYRMNYGAKEPISNAKIIFKNLII